MIFIDLVCRFLCLEINVKFLLMVFINSGLIDNELLFDSL